MAPSAPRTVSIMVPTYRRPDLLAQTLASVAAQTYRSWDVLVCDNANDPASAQVVAALDDERFTYLGRPENLGMTRSAFDGLQRLDGDLVMELDDDDILYPRCLEVLVTGFDHDPAVTMSTSDVDLIDVDGALMEQETLKLRQLTGRGTLREGVHRPFTELAAPGRLSTVSALFRREAIDWDRLPMPTHTAYDLHLSVAAAADNGALWYTREPLAGYRIHVGRDSWQALQAQLQGADFTLRYALASGRYEATAPLQEALDSIDIRLARVRLRAGERQEAIRLLRSVLGTSNSREAAQLLAVACLPNRVRERVLEARLRKGGDPVTGPG